MPFTTVMTGTAQVDDSIKLAFEQGFILSASQAQIMDQFVTYQAEIGAKSIQFPKYGLLALATTPLSESEDLASVALSDSAILLTPKEYGNVVTTTNLAQLQTGGLVNLAAAETIGQNMARSMDKLAIDALAASANQTEAVVSGATLDAQYSRLAAKSIPTFGEGAYVALMAESEIAKLRAEAGFYDVAKYANATDVLKNEVGFYKGHKIVRHPAVAAGSVISLGMNGLGKAVSQEPRVVVNAAADKLGRFVHIGWVGTFTYGIVDDAAVEVIVAETP